MLIDMARKHIDPATIFQIEVNYIHLYLYIWKKSGVMA